MKKLTVIFATLMAALLLVTVVASGPVTHLSYFLASDADGVQQVYQLLLDGQSAPRQLTRAASDVRAFGAAYDGLSVAYISGGKLWLQPIHTDEAEALADISAEQFFASPVYSQDGQYIAYADNGVWLLDLGTRETQQVLADVPLEPSGSNMADYRIYRPEVFVPGVDGAASKLIVDIGIWEWNTAGVYDLATGALQVLEGQLHTDLLPLSGGGALLYGNGGVAGEFALHLADSLDDINTYTRIVDFAALTGAPAEWPLFAEQAVEIVPGVVRVFGSTFGATPDEVNSFTFDYDLTAEAAGSVTIVTLSRGSQGSTVAGDLSPDGRLLPVYQDAAWGETGGLTGALELRDLLTGEMIAAAFPDTVGQFAWQP